MYDNNIGGCLEKPLRTPEEIARLQAIFDNATGTTAEQRAQNAPEGGETVSGAFTPPPVQSRPELTDGGTDADFEAMPEDEPAPDTPPDYSPEDTGDDYPEDLPGDREQTGGDRPAPRNMKPLPKKIKSADNLPFVQMPHCITVSDMTDAEYRLYGLLLRYHTMRRGVNVSVSQMAAALGKAPRNIKVALASLEAKGYINRQFCIGKNTKITLFYPESSDENITPTGDENITPTGDENITPTGDENITHNKNEYNKNENNNIQRHSQTRARVRENTPPEDTKTDYKVLINFNPARKDWEKNKSKIPFTGVDVYDKLDAKALSIGYTMSFDEMIKFLHAMIEGGIRDKNGCFTSIRDFDDLLRSWSKAQSEQEHQIALQERAKLASGGEIRSTIPVLNDGESVYVCHRLKSCPTLRDKLKEMLNLKFPKAENIQSFLSAFDDYGDKEHFFQVFQQLPETDTVFDCNRFLNSRSKFYLKLD